MFSWGNKGKDITDTQVIKLNVNWQMENVS